MDMSQFAGDYNNAYFGATMLPGPLGAVAPGDHMYAYGVPQAQRPPQRAPMPRKQQPKRLKNVVTSMISVLADFWEGDDELVMFRSAALLGVGVITTLVITLSVAGYLVMAPQNARLF